VLEQDEDGTPFYLYQKELNDIFSQVKNKIQFVFVASCHSENMAVIFRKAGVKHVICIREEHPVSDEAMLFFANKFYNILFC
jgi:hypothetical protein